MYDDGVSLKDFDQSILKSTVRAGETKRWEGKGGRGRRGWGRGVPPLTYWGGGVGSLSQVVATPNGGTVFFRNTFLVV